MRDVKLRLGAIKDVDSHGKKCIKLVMHQQDTRINE
jgi:hypothetical protein